MTDTTKAAETRKAPGTDDIGRTPEKIAEDLRAQGVSPSAATASGQAAAGVLERPDKSQQKGGEGASDAKPDAVKAGAPPVGLQATHAFFTAGGSIDSNSIPSPSGPVPAGLIADPNEREAAIAAARAGAVDPHQGGHKTGRYRISGAATARMSPAELRAVAGDRGYTGIEGGRRAIQAKFLAAQKDDDSLVDPPEGHRLGETPTEGSATVPPSALAQTGTVIGTPPAPAVGAASAAPATGSQAAAASKVSSSHTDTAGKPVTTTPSAGGAK